MKQAVKELAAAMRAYPTAWHLAWAEMLARYRRSVLGPFWAVLSTLIGAAGLSVVWSVLLRVEFSDFVPSLTIGLVTWQFVSGAVLEGTTVFQRHAGTILSIKVPIFLISLQQLFRSLINLAHSWVVVAIVLAVLPGKLGLVSLLFIPGLVLISLTMLPLIHVMGFLCTRYRDLETLITSVMPILFFLSPVIYQTRQLGDVAFVMALNPFTHWIHLVRDPLLGQVPDLLTYAAALAMLVASWLMALWLTTGPGRRLPYWL